MLESAAKLLRRTNLPDAIALAEQIQGHLREGGSDIPLREPITPLSKVEEVLRADGASIYTLGDVTISNQMQIAELDFPISNEVRELLRTRPSPRVRVAIFPNPHMFFVQDTEGKSLPTQMELVQKDVKQLRKWYGVVGIDEFIPTNASTLIELTIRHWKETGKLLFGRDYGFPFARTLDPGEHRDSTDVFADPFKIVGYTNFTDGITLSEFSGKFCRMEIKAVRLLAITGEN
ncbi:hypothetical protein A2Z00_00995 [Candidatus Gottesmanbacteria bacterium RBG_13_45_10]|uniref:Uncharacterized protein n=1 Tax=Candidatus Gottesmanbacteria bacterium RBG_13_45_10 TaxID=1798370 RepID=A0A1F5ZHN1_9BACT|nr:MAG: hypothetical protein A2Z00_00995 [Candidatus Gottesmanbacteria bacterium RBG_13_45_10]